MTTPPPSLSDRRPLIATTLLAVAVDAVTKLAAVTLLEDSPIQLGPLVSLRVVLNTGVAFGLGANAPSWVLLSLTAAVVAYLTYLAWRGRLAAAVPSGLILGGAIANVADRAIGGSVIDLIDIRWWPTFNMADVFIVTGICLITWSQSLGTSRTHSAALAGSAARARSSRSRASSAIGPSSGFPVRSAMSRGSSTRTAVTSPLR